MANDTIIERKTFPEGGSIFRQGDTGRCAYIVQEGEVEIVHTNGNAEKVLATIGKGGIFGEMSLIDDSPRMASARAAMPTTLILITHQMFLAKMEKTDPFIRGLLHIMADTIRTQNK